MAWASLSVSSERRGIIFVGSELGEDGGIAIAVRCSSLRLGILIIFGTEAAPREAPTQMLVMYPTNILRCDTVHPV
jgi:hypothetical protein